MEEKEIINRLKELGLEMSKQNGRSTNKPLWCEQNDISCRNYSFFESDVKHSKDNYVLANYQAIKMNELRRLIIELSGEDIKYF